MTLVINGKTYEASELIAYVENLEKENAEMKEDNGKLNRKVELLKEELLNPKDKCYSKDKEQLATAKHIIIECIDVMSFHDCEYTDAYKKAKDFILIENGELND